MPDQNLPDLDPDEIRDEIHSAVERIREEFRKRHSDATEAVGEPDLLRESEAHKAELS